MRAGQRAGEARRVRGRHVHTPALRAGQSAGDEHACPAIASAPGNLARIHWSPIILLCMNIICDQHHDPNDIVMLAASWRSCVAHPVTQALLCPNAVVHALAVVAGERATAPTVVPPIGGADKRQKRARYYNNQSQSIR